MNERRTLKIMYCKFQVWYINIHAYTHTDRNRNFPVTIKLKFQASESPRTISVVRESKRRPRRPGKPRAIYVHLCAIPSSNCFVMIPLFRKLDRRERTRADSPSSFEATHESVTTGGRTVYRHPDRACVRPRRDCTLHPWHPRVSFVH